MVIRERLIAWLRRAEVDRAVFFGLLTRIWSVVAGPVTALLIAANFSPVVQGYYYTFSSILAFQFIVELGLGSVIIQFASHEWSRLTTDESGAVTGDEVALSRLQGLAVFATRWYLIASVILTVGLMAGGWWFFSKPPHGTVYWMLPWLSLCLLNGVLFSLTPLWSLLEGCNQVAGVYTYRFVNGLCMSLAMWVAIVAGAELWTVCAVNVAGILCAALFLLRGYRRFLWSLLAVRSAWPGIDWVKEILPFQWRFTLSWLIGGLSVFLFAPVLFYYHGPVIAGQFGMTWSVIGFIGAVASSWITPKVPRFGMLIARREYGELDSLFRRITAMVIGATVLMAAGFWLLILLLNAWGLPLAQRLLPPLPTGIFLLAIVIQASSLPFSVYLRAHKREPLVVLSILQGTLVAAAVLVLGKWYSAPGMALGYLAVNVLVIPWTLVVWYRCRALWHADEAGDAAPSPDGA